jgi:hypothetical protein
MKLNKYDAKMITDVLSTIEKNHRSAGLVYVVNKQIRVTDSKRALIIKRFDAPDDGFYRLAKIGGDTVLTPAPGIDTKYPDLDRVMPTAPVKVFDVGLLTQLTFKKEIPTPASQSVANIIALFASEQQLRWPGKPISYLNIDYLYTFMECLAKQKDCCRLHITAANHPIMITAENSLAEYVYVLMPMGEQ